MLLVILSSTLAMTSPIGDTRATTTFTVGRPAQDVDSEHKVGEVAVVESAPGDESRREKHIYTYPPHPSGTRLKSAKCGFPLSSTDLTFGNLPITFAGLTV
ncbi:hypothetical protein Bca52824_026876 [Brassica carinata]|uniref:Uncharacterized protein n=1 Tax=Brassica carinata TaxID=52824 RepID=A0A8X7SIP2_BRACI|nr:hypothetical protein Bca52824_026876 [Brassica carinata]